MGIHILSQSDVGRLAVSVFHETLQAPCMNVHELFIQETSSSAFFMRSVLLRAVVFTIKCTEIRFTN